MKKKLYAYSDGDGFIRFNVLGGKDKRLFNKRTGEYDEPEPDFDIEYIEEDNTVMWVAIIGAYFLLVLGMVL